MIAPLSCPVCRAENPPPGEPTAAFACRRCKADLRWLWESEQARSWWIAQARQWAQAGQPTHAYEALSCAQRWRVEPHLEAILAMLALQCGKFAEAHDHFHAMKQSHLGPAEPRTNHE